MPTVPTTPSSGSGYVRSSSSLSAYRDVGPGPRPSSVVPGSRTSSRMSSVASSPFNKASSRVSTLSASTGTGPGTASSSEYDVYTSESSSAASPPPPTATRARRLSSLQAPTVVPRANKSAMLRVQKQANDAAKPKSPYANASKR